MLFRLVWKTMTNLQQDQNGEYISLQLSGVICVHNLRGRNKSSMISTSRMKVVLQMSFSFPGQPNLHAARNKRRQQPYPLLLHERIYPFDHHLRNPRLLQCQIYLLPTIHRCLLGCYLLFKHLSPPHRPRPVQAILRFRRAASSLVLTPLPP